MSIYGYTGRPGSGKTYDVVANQVMPALKAGRHVVTNIPLELEAIRALIPDARLSEFPMEQVQASPELIDHYAAPGCVLILDEVWRLWPSGQKSNQVPEPFRKLLAEHRHMVDEAGNSMQIVLVTQDLAQIGAFARQLIENTFHHTKLSHVGASGSYRVDVYQGPVSGPNPPRQSRLREIFGRYDPAIFKLYKSYTMSRAAGPGASEASMDKRANVWHRPMIYVGLAVVVAAVMWGVPQLRETFAGSPVEVSAVQPGQEVRRKTLVDGVAPAAVGRRGGWRVSGFMGAPDKTSGRVVLTDGRVSVTVALERYCLWDVDVGPICQWEGQEVTVYSEQAYQRPAAVAAAPVPQAP